MIVQPGQYVNIHAHRYSSGPDEWTLTNIMVEDYPPAPDESANYSVGLHPWNIENVEIPDSLKKVQMATENFQVLAIGETGLDRLNNTSKSLQLRVFEAQIEIAEFACLPLIIHAVKTHAEMIHLVKTHRPSVPMIIHGFRGSRQLAEDLAASGFFLSFGDSLMRSESLRMIFKSLPLESLFLETDESESKITDIYKTAATIREISIEELRWNMAEKTDAIFERKVKNE